MNRIIAEDVDIILNEDIPYKKFYGKTVLISGASGYVPAYFVHTFMSLNDRENANITVIALCRSEDRAKKRFQDYLSKEDFVLKIQDVCDEIMYEGSIHYFIHAASPAGIYERHRDPVNTFLSNVRGADNMLRIAKNNPCEGFLLLSSVDVYGKVESTERLTEEMSGYLDQLNVRNTYSCAKRAAESLCKAYQVKYHIPVFIVRPFQIIGPGPELGDGRLHIDFIGQILKNEEIVLKSDGEAVRSFIYITDAIIAMFYVLFFGIPGEAFNIVTEKGECSVRDLATTMVRNVEDRDIGVVYDLEQRNSVEVRDALSVVCGDSAKLRKLGFKSRYSISEGTERMMNYYGIKTKGTE